MLQVFRSFQWSGLGIAVALALVLRAAGFLTGIPPESAATLGPLGGWLAEVLSGGPALHWLLGSVAVAALGFLGAYTLQDYRLGAHGTVPTFVTVLLGSAASWWLGWSPLLVGVCFVALAAQRFFAGYRHQGAALPVYDCGLLIGAAWLIDPGFAWFAIWGALTLGQLRKFRFTDLLGFLLGAATLPVLFGMGAFVWGDFDAFRHDLLDDFGVLPDVAGLSAAWPLLAVAALLTGAAFGPFGLLTTRRPIQEQRAARMWYTMLGVGWVALLCSGPLEAWSFAFLLYPLGVLLGIWLAELDRKRGDIVAIVGVALVAGGYVYAIA